MEEQNKPVEPIEEDATVVQEPEAASAEEPAPESEAEQGESPAKKALGACNRAGAFFASDRCNPLAAVDMLDDVIAWARRVFPVEMFDTIATSLVKYGHLGLIVAEAACVILGLTAAFKMNNWRLFPAGIGVALLLVILQYTASRFMDAGDRLLSNSPSRLGSDAFMDCLALLVEVLGISLFFTYWFVGGWGYFFVGLALWALCDAVAYIALHPSMVNIDVGGEVGAGEEAIGIMSLAIKTIVRLVPMAFGIGAILGSIALIAATLTMMRSGDPTAAISALRLITACVLLPFFSYILFAFYHLLIDLLRAILVLGQHSLEGDG
ncbi:MAG: hypothetical protein QGH42_11040 [Kiritimatiellia bacterium]|jgi:hypothetical protein|nr:hypothetical protein [Kiritimatiellia bacterium]MDP6809987.1 hypothetical protein [Kiritimatiellia bacterium]MDP7024758.1 hypothetical protein [Kiritimatiellia bacterium]